MFVRQIRLKMMSTFCYLVGDEISGTCALIDPAFEVDKILAAVAEEQMRVSFVINTHAHADHTAGNAQIIKETQARLLIHEEDAVSLDKMGTRIFARLLGGRRSPQPDILLKDEFIVNIGETSLKVIHTPGHSPGSICLYGSGQLFTGDTLFVGAVGRTDLRGGSHDQLQESITSRIFTLPDETVIWPGHDYGKEPSSTVFKEKTTNIFVISS